MAAVDDDDDDHVVSRLSSLSLIDAASCIVGGADSVLDTDMAFVNRHEELWQLFRVNADNLMKIVKHE